MNIEQTLGKLQDLIHETLPNLELFVDGNVQPSSTDCENLQRQLFDLQGKLSVYKHLKTTTEISPSFGIHSKVSEASFVKEEIKVTEDLKESTPEVLKASSYDTLTNEYKNEGNHKKLEISLNQKFQFINELFQQNATEYGLAIDQLNNCANGADAESYLLSLKSVYDWKDQNDTYKRLRELCKHRFA
ncbi:MAG: hypothetical protein SGJ15_13140 [Bacteroidota bacterium]|nr:hypothetical protein [Bacteroidota bacterium]